MAFLKDIGDGIRIGRHISRERSFGKLSMALSRSSQVLIERRIVESMHDRPSALGVIWSVAVGQNLGIVGLGALAIAVAAWLLIR